jgi:hypothetical protein
MSESDSDIVRELEPTRARILSAPGGSLRPGVCAGGPMDSDIRVRGDCRRAGAESPLLFCWGPDSDTRPKT